MDHQRFEDITRLAANGPDRRNMLKLAGAAAVAGIAGFLARADDADAKMLVVNILNVGNNLTTQVLVRAKTTRGARKVATQICAAVDQINVNLGLGTTLFCEYPGQ
jgi:hypothetical protein